MLLATCLNEIVVVEAAIKATSMPVKVVKLTHPIEHEVLLLVMPTCVNGSPEILKSPVPVCAVETMCS